MSPPSRGWRGCRCGCKRYAGHCESHLTCSTYMLRDHRRLPYHWGAFFIGAFLFQKNHRRQSRDPAVCPAIPWTAHSLAGTFGRTNCSSAKIVIVRYPTYALDSPDSNLTHREISRCSTNRRQTRRLAVRFKYFKYPDQLPLKLRMHGLRQPQSGRIRSRAKCGRDAFRKPRGVKRDYEYEQYRSDTWRLWFYIFIQRFDAREILARSRCTSLCFASR